MAIEFNIITFSNQTKLFSSLLKGEGEKKGHAIKNDGIKTREHAVSVCHDVRLFACMLPL